MPNANSGLTPVVFSGRRDSQQGTKRGNARQEGLEPPTYGLEGRCSIQLSYCRIVIEGRLGCPSSWMLVEETMDIVGMLLVGARGFEPPTSCSQSKRATGLRYAPRRTYFTRAADPGQIFRFQRRKAAMLIQCVALARLGHLVYKASICLRRWIHQARPHASSNSNLKLVPKNSQEIMNSKQQAHFQKILQTLKEELLGDVERTVHTMQEEATVFADPNDRASQESDIALELRNRDRERKLIKKIDEALDRIDKGEYGYCDSCGVEIGLKRLEARPTATLCIDCKTLEELREKQVAK